MSEPALQNNVFSASDWDVSDFLSSIKIPEGTELVTREGNAVQKDQAGRKWVQVQESRSSSGEPTIRKTAGAEIVSNMTPVQLEERVISAAKIVAPPEVTRGL